MTTPTRQPLSDDWDKHWTDQAHANTLNPAQVYRRNLVNDALALTGERGPVRLLDLGSGSGEFAREVLSVKPDAEVLGLDLSDVGIAISRKKVPQAQFFQQDFTKPITLESKYLGWATHVVCSEVLEHLDDPAGMLRNTLPYLAPGCRFVVTVPGGPMSAFDKHIGHRKHFSPGDLETLLREGGLDVVDLRGAGFPFFNLYRLAVVARGAKLIDDAAESDGRTLPASARAAIHLFSWLFRFNTTQTKLGWQLMAVAVPRAAH